MTLDPHPTTAQLLAKKAEREARRTPSGIRLGPGSPLLPAPRAEPSAAPRSRGKRTGPSEHQLQVALFDWLTDPATLLEEPDLAYAFAVPNGGKRTPAVAAKLKAEGVKRGPPDVWLPVRRAAFAGCVIEMKRPGGSVTPEQADWLAALARQGWHTAVHTTTDGARMELLAYVRLPRYVPEPRGQMK